ncbi:MAG: Ig-like domain-containing protein [Clostridia bacterium]|nr:Ig-like domain-containing protein [Clostridia bacterium]
MKQYTKRLLSWVLAVSLLITCGISGLVLPASADANDNLFVNGDFEQGATTEWESSTLIVSGQGKGGGWGYYYDRTETNTNVGAGMVRYKKALLSKMEASTAYILSFDYKTSGNAQAQLYMDKNFGPRSDAESNLYGGLWLTKSVDTWTSMSIPFTTLDSISAGTGYEFAIRTVGGAGGVWYDNFKLIKAPTAATTLTLNKTVLSLEVGQDETLTATTLPEGAAAEPIVWTTSDSAVATVTAGKVTAVAAGTATITATAGTLTATCAVTVTATTPPPVSGSLAMPNGDFNAAASGWKYASTVAGQFNAGDPVPVQTDAAGNKYIQIPANGKVIKGPTVTCDVKANDWIRVDMKVRKNSAGKMRFAMQVQGITGGYLQPDWIISTSDTGSSNDGKWMTFTFFAKAEKDATSLYLQALEIAGNTTADLTLDLDDIKLTNLGQVADTAIPLFANGSMDEPAAEFNDYSYGGLFNDGGEIVADPDDASNNVLKMTSAGMAYFLPSVRTWREGNATKVASYKANTLYKLTYRMKGTGTTSVSTSAAYATLAEVIGEPNKASAEWKTIVAYVRTTGSLNANYTFVFRTSGEVYLDDMTLTEVTDVDSIVLDKTSVSELMPGDEEQLTATTTPSGYTVVWSTSDATVATVENGKITAVGEGTATITATAGTKSAACTVTVVDPGKATAITLNKTEIYLVKGNSETLTVITQPEASRYDSLSWDTSDATLATVVDGVVTAAADKEGVVTITATAMVDGTPLTATCKVTVVGNATGIEATVEELHLAEQVSNTLNVSETIELKITPTGAYTGALTWTTGDASVATVENGKVTAHAAGTTTITVSNGTLSDTVTVKVDTFGERITGGDFEGTDWNTPYWTTNVIKDGRATLVADPANPENTVLSIAGKSTAGWYLWPTQVNAGRTYKLTYKAMNANGSAYGIYLESSKAVANGGWKRQSIAKEGWTEVSHIFTMYGSDINRNYVIAFGNHDSATLYIDDISLVELPEATAVKIVPGGEVKLMPNGSTTLSATTVPAEASAGVLTWTSSAPEIVAVDSKGVITAVAESGSAVITVTTDKGLTDSVTVTVDEYANLLENGDFESGNALWGGTWAESMIQPGIGKDGSYGFLVHNTTGSSRAECYYKKAIPVQPATTYILTFDYYATASSKSLRIYSGTLNIGSKYAANGEGEWKTATHVFTTKADMKLNTNYDLAIVCDGEGGEDVVIDNICLKLYDTGVEATSIKLNHETLTLMPGRTGALTINPFPTNGDINRAVWSSSNEDVATVEYGVVTAVGKGEATITAKLRNGLTATCKVTVSGEEALIKNGTFSDNDNWELTGASAIADGLGSVAKDGTIRQTVTGLKPETTYQLFVRYRSENGSKVGIALTNGTASLLEAAESANAAWTKKTFEFTTPAAVESTSVLTFTVNSGNGPVYIDHILLAQKATLVDLKVDSVVWDGGYEQVKPGTELTFAVTFSNYGEDAVKADSTIDIDICLDGKPIQRLTYTVGNAGFAKNETDMVIGTEKWAAVAGDHVISARINASLSVLEMNTDNNNTVQSNLRVAEEFIETPEIAENAGFTHLTFSDDFNSLHTIDQFGTGADGYKWYITRPYSAPNVETDDYEIKDGYMNLRLKKPNYNYGLGTMDIKTGIGYEFQYGYMEFRIRMHPYDSEGEGGPAIWSLPYDKLTNQCTRWVEMDWMEYWGTPSYAKEGRFTVTMHDNTSGDEGGEHWYKNPNHAVNGMGDGEWHTLGFLWDYGVIIAYMDGREIMRQTYDLEGGVNPMATVAEGENPFPADAYQPMNTHALPFTICGSLDNQMDIDYLYVWTGTGGGSLPEPDKGENDDDEEIEGDLGDGDVIVDIPAQEFWENYCTDDWGDPILAINAENKAYVLMGGEWWSYLSAERKAEINALLAQNGQPTFDELLAKAQGFAEEGEDTEQTPPTGVTTALPLLLTATLFSAAVLVITRKRKVKQ